MSQNTQRDIRTLAYVLRRTNYGESDRILNIITPSGKMSVIAKGVRKEKSKLAGGVEIFTLTELNIHFGKREMGLVTSAKMVEYYSNLLTDLGRMELASLILRKISIASEHTDNEEFFKITDSCLRALNRRESCELVECWFWLNYAKALGEQINLYRDANGEKLLPEERYYWNISEAALVKKENGDVDTNTIKIMRLMVSADIGVICRIVDVEQHLPTILRIARAINKI